MAETSLSQALHERLDQMGAPRMADSEIPSEDLEEPGEAPAAELDNEDNLVDDDADESEAEEQEGEEGEPETTGEGEGPQRYKVAELAEAIGWSAADLYNDLEVPIGGGKTLTLSEMKDQYEQVEQQRAEVEAARGEIQQQLEAVRNYQHQLVQGSQEVNAKVQEAQANKKAIELQYAQIDWEAAEQQDPGRAANARQKFATAYARADAAEKKAVEEAEGERRKVFEQTVAQHNAALVQLVPEWKDQKTYQEEMPGIQQYLMSRGFQPQELEMIYDARARAIARDAWLWNQHKANVSKGADKVRRAPKKIIRGGRAPAVPSVTDRQVDALSQQALETGRTSDRLNAARAIVRSSIARKGRTNGTRTRSSRS